jgi:type 1 glutamine amidotransferase
MKKSERIHRREVLRSAGAIALTGALGASGKNAMSQARQSPIRPRTLALVGDYAHNCDAIRVSLNRLFKELDLPIDYTTNYYDLSKSLLEPYQLFVFFRDNYIFPNGRNLPAARPQSAIGTAGGGAFANAEYWVTEEQGQAVKEFVAAGNGLYSLHSNAFVSRSSKNYRDVQGGVGLNHPPLRPFKVRVVNKEHPVTQGIEDFMVTDEQHYTIYDKDPKNILLHSENVDGLTFDAVLRDPKEGGPEASGPRQNLGTTAISGWAHEYGQGKVVFTAMGHTIHSMWQPEYIKLQKNAVRWLLKIG